MLNALMNTGTLALLNAQFGISVTSQNIANVDTEGYSRLTVSYENTSYVDVGDWQIGTGATVTEVVRHFNEYVEKQYLSSNSDRAYWDAQSDTLYNVETLFDEENDYGVSTALDAFFTSLDALAQSPSSEAQREELLSYADTLADTLRLLDASLEEQVATLNDDIEDSVDDVNSLIEDIASLNASIAADQDNATFLDQRTAKIRELSEFVDIKTFEQDNGMVTVMLAEGQTLVDDTETFRLSYEGPQAASDLSADSEFDGQIYFDGELSSEIHIEFTGSGAADGSATAATFRVSLDGGETWVTDEDGEVMEYAAGGYEDRIDVEGVSIWFGSADDPLVDCATDLAVDDRFNVVAKSGVYWYKTTSNKVNVTPLDNDSSDSDGRLSGGSLGGLLAVRDQSVSAYLEELDALAEELVWQVNYQHSQGAGLDHYTYSQAANAVEDTAVALADSGLAFADRLSSGSLSLALYDEDTGDALGVTAIDFSSIVPPGEATFDPAQHSLEDVASAINDSMGGDVTASISDGRLVLAAADGVEFEFAGDTTGILAATGTNTFFSGEGLDDIAVDTRVASDVNRINAARVDGTGLVEEGDNTTIEALAALAEANVSLDTHHSTAAQSFTEHFHGIVARVGLDMDTAARNYTLSDTLAEELDTVQQSTAGVSLDEELANLTKYQQSYQAAAKIIQTANEMFETVLALKS